MSIRDDKAPSGHGVRLQTSNPHGTTLQDGGSDTNQYGRAMLQLGICMKVWTREAVNDMVPGQTLWCPEEHRDWYVTFSVTSTEIASSNSSCAAQYLGT